MTPLSDLLDEVMLLQTNWSEKNTGDMEQRGNLIRTEIPAWISQRSSALSLAMGIPEDEFLVNGRDGTGRKAEIPWVRFASRRASPRATDGWYVVYLFEASGEACYLTLLCGATRWDGVEFHSRSDVELRDAVDWAHDRVESSLGDPRIVTSISLGTRRTTLGRDYERATVCAIEYRFGDVPDDTRLESDVRFMATLLARLMKDSSPAQPGARSMSPTSVSPSVAPTGPVAIDEVIKSEQRHFDGAWEHRELRREALKSAHLDAGGSRKTMGQLRKSSDRELQRMDPPEARVAFGRFDQGDEVLYVGEHLIYDSNHDPLVISWQSPAAQPFYQATHKDSLGVTLKRQFDTKKNQIQSFDDVLFEDLARRVENLTGAEASGIDDAVLRELDAAHSGEMRSIVQTIHAAQYELIRWPMQGVLVIQGGPGTGKTAVALHRVSWLLYNHSGELSPGDVLVIGPSQTFARYIKSVLPGLGDQGVPQIDLKSLGPTSSHGRPEGVELARLKGESRMAGLLRRGLTQRIRVPEQADVLTVGRGSRSPSFERSELETQIARRIDDLYNTGRNGLRSWLMREAERRSPRGVDVTVSQVDAVLDRVWPSLTPMTFLRDLLGSRERLIAAAGDDFSAAEVARLYRPAAERITEESWSDTDVALLDEIQGLISGSTSTYGHIAVDEAQDLSPMQLRSVSRRSRNGSMTVVGDIAQSTGPWSRDTWTEVRRALEAGSGIESDVQDLTLGYRVPKQIYDFAAALLPLVAPEAVPPVVVREGPADPILIKVEVGELAESAIRAAREHASSGRFVGIVCPDSLREPLEGSLTRQDVQWADGDEGELNSAINVVSPANAKGLEFDAVVVVEPSAIVAQDARGHRLLYIALTRTTRYLTVVFSTVALPLEQAGGMEPGAAPVLRTLDDVGEEVLDFERAERSEPGTAAQIGDPGPQARRDAGPAVASATAGSGRGSSRVDALAEAVARALGEQIRDTVSPKAYTSVIGSLCAELDIEVEDLHSGHD